MPNLFQFLWSLVTLENYLRAVLYLTPATFGFYVLVMHFKRAEQVLPRDLLTLGEVLLIVGQLHNVAFNVLVGTVLFLDPPRELTTTGRLNRYWRDGKGGPLRQKLALFIRHRLDPFDARGIHS